MQTSQTHNLAHNQQKRLIPDSSNDESHQSHTLKRQAQLHPTLFKTPKSSIFFAPSPNNTPSPSSNPTPLSDSKVKLKIVTWNANGILVIGQNKVAQLTQLLEEESIDVACITETHLKPTQKLYVQNYTVHRTHRPNAAYGGFATIVKNSIRHKAISI